MTFKYGILKFLEMKITDTTNEENAFLFIITSVHGDEAMYFIIFFSNKVEPKDFLFKSAFSVPD